MKSPVDIYAGLSFIASGGLATTAVSLAKIAPDHEVQILAISSIAVGISGLLVRIHKNPTLDPVQQPQTDNKKVRRPQPMASIVSGAVSAITNIALTVAIDAAELVAGQPVSLPKTPIATVEGKTVYLEATLSTT